MPRFLIALEAELASIKDPPGPKSIIGGPRISRGELSLVENLELDETTVLSEIAGRAEVRNSLPLYLLGQRFGVLAGKPAFDSENLPIGPQALCRMIRQASICLELAGEHRQLLFRTFERHLMPLYGNFVGVSAAGITESPGGEPLGHLVGIHVHDSPDTTIGGTGPAENNIVSGNVYGIEVDGGSDRLKIAGNLIGTTFSGQGLGATRNTNGVAIVADALDEAPADVTVDANTISGSTRGWISRPCGTGSPAGSTIASVSQAVSGLSMPIRCCLARLVRPSLTPISRSPRASRRRSVSSCTR